MYNLLVTAERGAWDGGFYEFDRSRFLEYTADQIATAFKRLTKSRIDQLKTLPCLFAYEGTTDILRLGVLTSVKERDRQILIEYQFYTGVPPIPYSSIEPIAPLLDIRSWEMNRTHWAIKDEDLIERLKSAKLIEDGSIPTAARKEAIPRVRKTETHASTAETVKDFIEQAMAAQAGDEFEVFYRGHSDRSRYKLVPSLFRKDDKGNYLYLDAEDVLYRELLVSNSADFVSDQYTLDRLIRMQHYSLPTRLLDITSNPLIALYFATKSDEGNEGEVIIFSLKRDRIKYFDSDTASCIANLARLPKAEKDQINFDLDQEKFNEQLAIRRLTHFIRQEKPFFEPRIIPDHLRSIVCVKGKRTNDRITSQSGAFLLFGLDTVLDEKGTPDIRVTRIAVAHKAAILRELDLLNVNESTVFPYIENSAKYVAQKYSFRASAK